MQINPDSIQQLLANLTTVGDESECGDVLMETLFNSDMTSPKQVPEAGKEPFQGFLLVHTSNINTCLKCVFAHRVPLWSISWLTVRFTVHEDG